MDFPKKGVLKYIVFGEGQFAIVFPSFLNHDEVARSLARPIYEITEPRPTSAGYCSQDLDGNWKARGKSVTLGLESKESDSQTIQEWYTNEWYKN